MSVSKREVPAEQPTCSELYKASIATVNDPTDAQKMAEEIENALGASIAR